MIELNPHYAELKNSYLFRRIAAKTEVEHRVLFLQLRERLAAIVRSRSTRPFPVVSDGIANKDDVDLAAGRRDLGEFLCMAVFPPARIWIPTVAYPDAAFRRSRRAFALHSRSILRIRSKHR